jgi:hypothetical protein
VSVPGLPVLSLRRWFTVVACAAVVPLCGCGAEAPRQTPQAEVPGGAVGPDERVSADVKVQAVRSSTPSTASTRREDAGRYLGISNAGPGPDVLVDVSGPDFADAHSGAGDGDALAIEVPADDNVYVGAEDAPALTLVDLGRPARVVAVDPRHVHVPACRDGNRAGGGRAEGQTPDATLEFPDPAEDPTDE